MPHKTERKTERQVREARTTVDDAALTRRELGEGLTAEDLLLLARQAQDEAAARRVLAGARRDRDRERAQQRLAAAQQALAEVNDPSAAAPEPREPIFSGGGPLLALPGARGAPDPSVPRSAAAGTEPASRGPAPGGGGRSPAYADSLEASSASGRHEFPPALLRYLATVADSTGGL